MSSNMPALISLSDISKNFTVKGRLKNVLQKVSIEAFPEEIIGIVGESGSGKSTLGLIVAGLLKGDGGELKYKNKTIKYPYRGVPRKEIQMIFQHPEVSFDPLMTLEKSLLEPYVCHRIPYYKSKLIESLKPYGINKEHLLRKPRGLSGGELQRLAIARVMVLSPSLIVLDEPTSMLDSISQAQVMQILKDINRSQGIAYLFITHDLILAQAFCDRILRIEDGRLVEE
jgi:peptide/nickel transport system ATP-binding protein